MYPGNRPPLLQLKYNAIPLTDAANWELEPKFPPNRISICNETRDIKIIPPINRDTGYLAKSVDLNMYDSTRFEIENLWAWNELIAARSPITNILRHEG